MKRVEVAAPGTLLIVDSIDDDNADTRRRLVVIPFLARARLLDWSMMKVAASVVTSGRKIITPIAACRKV